MGIVKKTEAKEPHGVNRAIGITSEAGEVANKIDLTTWLSEEAWPQPTWLTDTRVTDGKIKEKTFEEYIRNALRWRYQRLEGDFRTVLNNFYNTEFVDTVTARRIISFLETARDVLQKDNFEVSNVSNLLDMADQYMVWLFPPHVALPQANALLVDLKAKNHVLAGFLEGEINRSDRTLGSLRAALDKVKDSVNQENQVIQINNGLQIERLQMLIKRGSIILGIMLIGLPLLIKDGNGTTTNADGTVSASLFLNTMLAKFVSGSFQPWVLMGAIALVGSVGAFLSGLMQIRRTRVTIGEFKESVFQFRLRPIIGSIFAMVITTLLSWDLISGIEIKNAGVFVLIAFLCGFSERFFLNLLKIDEEGNSTREAGTPIVAAPVGGAASVSTVNDEGQVENVNERRI